MRRRKKEGRVVWRLGQKRGKETKKEDDVDECRKSCSSSIATPTRMWMPLAPPDRAAARPNVVRRLVRPVNIQLFAVQYVSIRLPLRQAPSIPRSLALFFCLVWSGRFRCVAYDECHASACLMLLLLPPPSNGESESLRRRRSALFCRFSRSPAQSGEFGVRFL